MGIKSPLTQDPYSYNGIRLASFKNNYQLCIVGDQGVNSTKSKGPVEGLCIIWGSVKPYFE